MTLDELIKKISNYRKKSIYLCGVILILNLLIIIALKLDLKLLLGIDYLRYGPLPVYVSVVAFFVFVIFIYFKFTKGYNKAIKKILENSDTYEKELKNIILSEGNNIYTENYVFFEYGLNICKYDEIIMVYVADIPSRGRVHKEWCMITEKGKIYTVEIESINLLANNTVYNTNFELDKLLSSKNPNILVGKTKENIKILRQKYNIRGIL